MVGRFDWSTVGGSVDLIGESVDLIGEPVDWWGFQSIDGSVDFDWSTLVGLSILLIAGRLANRSISSGNDWQVGGWVN